MAALLGMSDSDAAALCDEAGECWPANYNCPGQVVASGTRAGIDRLLGLVAEQGGKATRLAVGGAFHSPLMEPAAERLRPALEAWAPEEPSIPFLSTTTAKREGASALRTTLLDQLTSPVRFGEAGQAAVEMGVTGVVEVGPGRVLSGLMKRINRRIPSRQIGAPGDLVGLEGL
jgi:[acyl-carrier-protein] S-malonyltransferase